MAFLLGMRYALLMAKKNQLLTAPPYPVEKTLKRLGANYVRLDCDVILRYKIWLKK